MATPVPVDMLPDTLRPSNVVPVDMLPDTLRPSNVVPMDMLPDTLRIGTGQEVASKPAAPTERPEDQSIFRQVADVPLQIQKGYVTGVRLIADSFGANNPASNTLRSVENFIGGLLSAQSKQDSAEMDRIMKEAQDKGVMAQVVAGVKALSVAPVDTVVNALGTSAPSMIAAIVGKTPAAAVVGALTGAGTVKSAIYDSVKEAYAKSNLSPEEIEKRATEAQEYFGPNLDMIATGVGLGVLESITGSEAVASRIANGVMTRKAAAAAAANVAGEVAEETAKRSIAGSVIGGAFKDAVPEFFQGSQEQLSKNIAAQREGFDVPTMRGVISQGVLEAGAGSVLGGVTSGIEAGAERQEVTKLKTKLDELQGTPPAPGSEEERVLQVAAQIQARGNVDHNNAMILAMKIVADEKILGEKVDGAKPPEQTGGAPLFIYDTPEQAQERTDLLKANRPKDNFEVQQTPDGKFAIYKVPVETTGGANVAAPIPEAGGVSPELPSQPGVGVPAGGAVAPVPTGLVPTGAVAGEPVAGEAVQPSALDKTERTKKRYAELTFATPEEAQSVLASLPDRGTKQVVETDEGFVIQNRPAKAVALETPPAVTPTEVVTEEPTVGDIVTWQDYPVRIKGQPFVDKDGVTKQLVEVVGEEYRQIIGADLFYTPVDELTITPTPEEVTTPTEKPSVTETPEAVKAETERAAEPAETAAPKSEEVVSAVETETEASIDEVTNAIEELIAASERRTAEAETREKGQAEPAELRRMNQKASEKLDVAISGKSGLINVIKKLNTELVRARAALEPYGGEQFDEGLLRQRGETTDEEHAQDIADMETAYAYYNSVKNARAQAIFNLAEFEANPVFEGHPAKAKALDAIRQLPYEDKRAAYKAVKEKTGQLLETERAATEPKEAAKPAATPTVTVKKKRRVTIPTASKAIGRQRSAAGLFSSAEIEKNRIPGYKSRDKLIEMPIDDFLALADEGKVRTKLEDVNKILDSGAQLKTLPLLIVDRYGRVEGHEGRHRAMALRERGYTTMPVILRSENIRWSEQLDPENFDYRPFPDTLKAQSKAADPSFTTPFPVAREDSMAPYTGGAAPNQTIIPPISQARAPKRLATSLRADPTFETFSGKSITQALAHIAATGNAFERALATRMLDRDNRAGVKDTKMYVLSPDQAAEVPEMEGANGLYDLGEDGDAIYLRGGEFEENGINNQTVLHEALHATVNKRMIYGMYARELGLPVPAQLERTVADISELMLRAQDALDQYIADGNKVTPEIQHLLDSDAFDLPTEFVAYGMTDPAMQRFLRDNVSGVVTKTNGLNDFVRMILDMLGLGPEHTSGLRDLIEYTHRLAATVNIDPETARGVLDTNSKNRETDIQATAKAAKRGENKSQEIQSKIEISAEADQVIEELGSLTNVAKNPKLWGEYLRAKFSDISFDGMGALLAAMPTHMVIELGVDKGIARLADIDTDVREMSTMRTRILNRVQEVATPWIKLSAPVQKQLGKVMAAATLAQIDPATDKTSDKALYDMYKVLTDDAKAVYKNVRDFYADQYAVYQVLLERAAKRMGGEEGSTETLAAIKSLYEVAKNKGPYFPLMRYGQFYARFGKGANKEFYMFESAGLRDAFVTRKMADLARKGERRTFDEMMETDDADRGNDVEGMRKELLKDNVKLQNIFSIIDKSGKLGDEKARAALKDQIYQMHLLSMPEASMRKHFIHRNGVTGFSGDALRNFLNSGTRMASQMARVRYSSDINTHLSAAKDSLKGNPEKDKLEALVKEVEARTNDELNPPIDDTFFEKLARKTNKVAFLYMLTSVKSAANQMFSLLNFTVPTLASRHGWGVTIAEMIKYMALGYGQMGVIKKNLDGSTSWVAPSIALSDRVAKDPDEQYAVMRMQDMGISDATRTYDLFMRRNKPSADLDSRWTQMTNLMGSLFHHAERISREVTFMTSFRLSKEKGMTKEQAVEQAVKDTNTALFDYSAWNRPRVLRPAPVRVVAQFKQFPMYVTLYLARNGYNMIKAGATAQERKEAATMLFGTLGMTALMAGASGTFGYSVIMGVIQGIRNALRDDDEEDPLEEKDFELWFRNVYLPELCGDNTIMGMKLSELIDSGVLNTATGLDVASGISLNNLWFHDTPEATRWKSGFDNLLISMMGPGVSVGRQVAASVDDFNNGDFLKGVEKLSPAFARGTVTSIRYGTEGALSSTGAEIKAKEDFTYAQLVAQAAGFRTTGLSQVMNNNFAIQQMINGLKAERSDLLKRLDNAILHGNDEDVESIVDEIYDFGGKYPTYRIKPSEIASSLKAREKIRRQSEAGLYLDKRARDFETLRERVLDNLESEAAK